MCEPCLNYLQTLSFGTICKSFYYFVNLVIHQYFWNFKCQALLVSFWLLGLNFVFKSRQASRARRCYRMCRATDHGAAQLPAAPGVAHLPRHGGWRRTLTCRATTGGAALSLRGPAVPTWQPLPRHWQWRCTFLSRATANGAAKKGYLDEIFSPMIYYLNSFQVWVIFI
jgi:hypothetical protein